MKLTDIDDPNYFHKVVDCQWACPAHTPVPEYIRLIAQGRYTDAYMINWKSNVFPGILGRTCDRPCEPACRRGRVEKEPVAICRLKRVAADFKDDVTALHAETGARTRTASASRWSAAVPPRSPSRAIWRRSAMNASCSTAIAQSRRHDAHADPEIPPAGFGDRRGMRLHPRSRHRHSSAASASTA